MTDANDLTPEVIESQDVPAAPPTIEEEIALLRAGIAQEEAAKLQASNAANVDAQQRALLAEREMLKQQLAGLQGVTVAEIVVPTTLEVDNDIVIPDDWQPDTTAVFEVHENAGPFYNPPAPVEDVTGEVVPDSPVEATVVVEDPSTPAVPDTSTLPTPPEASAGPAPLFDTTVPLPPLEEAPATDSTSRRRGN